MSIVRSETLGMPHAALLKMSIKCINIKEIIAKYHDSLGSQILVHK